MLLLILFFQLVLSCSNTKKVECGVLASKCGNKCYCGDNFTCYGACMKCMGKTSASCCKCLFPHWGMCENIKTVKAIVSVSKYVIETGGNFSWTDMFVKN